MEIDKRKIEAALRRIIEVEREHLFGAATGSQTARRRDVERAIDRVVIEIREERNKPAKAAASNSGRNRS
jgi:hypothetical protein